MFLLPKILRGSMAHPAPYSISIGTPSLREKQTQATSVEKDEVFDSYCEPNNNSSVKSLT
jgi:hypothetical protein